MSSPAPFSSAGMSSSPATSSCWVGPGWQWPCSAAGGGGGSAGGGGGGSAAGGGGRSGASGGGRVKGRGDGG